MSVEGARLHPGTAFQVGAREQRIGTRFIRGGAASLVGQVSRTVVQLVGTMVLARILSPTDYGLMSMSLVVVGLAQMFKDAGLSMATIQSEEISESQVSSLFWVNLGLSALIALVVLVSSPLVASFYGRSELSGITSALSVSFLVSGVAVQHEAMLRRHMRFGALAIVGLVAQIVNVGVALAAAVAGYGYWSLVMGTAAGAVASAVATLFFFPWRPKGFERGCGLRSMLRFGADVTGFNFVTYFARNADYLLIGRYLGASPLGLYTRAYQLFMLPITQIGAPMNDVAMPTLSALKGDTERYASYFRRFLDVLALLTVPLALYCVIEAEFIIGVMLGEQWLEAAPVLRLLAVVGVTQAVATTRGLVLLSNGLTRRYLHLGLVNALVAVTSFVLGLPYGIRGVAFAYAVSGLLFFPLSLWVFMRSTPVSPRDFGAALARPMALSLLATVGAVLAREILNSDTVVAHLAVGLVFAAMYTGLAYTSATIRGNLKTIFGALFSHSAETDVASPSEGDHVEVS